jgi:hypothetical protein
MKTLIIGALTALALAACTSTPTGTSTNGKSGTGTNGATVATAQTQAGQAAADVRQGLAGACPLLQAVVSSLDSPLVVLPVSAKADLAIATPIINTACAAAYSGDLASLVNTALPNLESAIMQAAGLGQTARDNLVAAQIVITALYNAQTAAQAGGVAPVAASPAAPAVPVPAAPAK